MEITGKLLSVLLFTLLIHTTPAIAEVPDFDQNSRQIVANLPAVNGANPVDAQALSGAPVLVTFFASWCPPCFEEFAHLNKLAHKYQATGLRIVAINVHEKWDDNDAERMAKFIDTTKPRFPTVTGSESIRTLFGGIDRIPTVYGFDRQGKLSYRFIHKRGSKTTNATFDELEGAARQLLGIE